ncbi:putative ferric-chelate reductase 1 isoform X2 [Silurus meridionalis]|uniref:putative ferric-chelate reductase 1 isoform X2 n=1 Tax=Silurus meridionalis TaxID=175797 RepID=UPI001EEA52E4|nr:putative ferric-chelate reductase 1 isoform X2 [Silurus meridionalis]
MEFKLIVALVLVCVLGHMTRVNTLTVTALQSSITQSGCGSLKTCMSSPTNCNPVGNSSCFFSSILLNNQSAIFELSGTTSGYVALGIKGWTQTQDTTTMFVCGNNNGSFFFNTMTQNGTAITTANVSTVYSVQGSVTQNQSLIQCSFNTSAILNISTTSNIIIINIATSNFTIMNGSTKGIILGNAAAIFSPITPVWPTTSPVTTTSISGSSTNSTMNNTNISGSSTNSTMNNTNISGSSTNSTMNNTNISGSNTNSTMNTTNISGSNTNSTMNTTIISGSNTNSTMNTTNISGSSTNTPSLNFSRTGCGSFKLCLLNQPSCTPTASGCFFASARMVNQTFLFELSGSTSGYVALGLTKQGSTYVFVCGNNTSNNSFFFQTATRNGTMLTAANVATVYSYRGLLANGSVQCVFNTSTILGISTKSNDTSYNATILSGSTYGTSLGNSTTQFSTNTAIDLSDPTALTISTTQSPTTTSGSSSSSAISIWTHVCAMLLSVMSLHFTTSYSP